MGGLASVVRVRGTVDATRWFRRLGGESGSGGGAVRALVAAVVYFQ